MIALDFITQGKSAPVPVPLGELGASHGISGSAGRMYKRFFGQEQVLIHPSTHSEMIKSALAHLLENRPELRNQAVLMAYAKTQTHNTFPDCDWLGSILNELGLSRWEAFTLSMTNCASALAAVHAFHADGRPLVVVSGEKAFHSSGNRLSVGLLGEAPVAALFCDGGGRQIIATAVHHLPRFHLNPDDMTYEDRKDLQTEFEAEFDRFLGRCIAANAAFFAQKPAVVPYNLNLPLVTRLLENHGLLQHLVDGHSAKDGHTFCSDNFLNLNILSVPPQMPVFLFCAGMGVTYAAVMLDAVRPHFSPQPPTF